MRPPERPNLNAPPRRKSGWTLNGGGYRPVPANHLQGLALGFDSPRLHGAFQLVTLGRRFCQGNQESGPEIPDAWNDIPWSRRAFSIAAKLLPMGTRRPFSKSRTVDSDTRALSASCC